VSSKRKERSRRQSGGFNKEDSVKVNITAGLALIGLTVAVLSAVPAAAQNTRRIIYAGKTSFHPTAMGSDALQSPEFSPSVVGDSRNMAGSTSPHHSLGSVNRSMSSGMAGQGREVEGKEPKSPELERSFDGLNHRQQRLANSGNQFSLEPPDQGLCAGNGFVMESVNDVLRVYDTHGNPLTGVTDLNTFYGYSAAINRTTHVFGQFVTDPSCYFDTDTQRWFQVVLTIEVNPTTGKFLGPNHLDLAVSETGDPTTTSWTIYRLPVQDDGTQGTPDHGCSLNPNGTGHGPCLGDYPHIGADANGFYMTINEYSFFGPEFHGAQIYAFSKRGLASSATSVAVTQFDTHGVVDGNSGFTVWPATSPSSNYALQADGTEYFLSSNAADEAHGNGINPGPRTSNHILLWAITNTESLNNTPALSLRHSLIKVNQYAVPPKANQKPGNFPLGQCLNDTACATFLLGAPDPNTETESPLDSNDTRMQQVVYANGKVCGALDTAVTVAGRLEAGVEYFVLEPSVSSTEVSGVILLQGDLALKHNNLIYPAVGVTSSGRGLIAFTVVGDDFYPSAGYAALDEGVGVGDVEIAASGAGPQDGFTGYLAFNNPTRPRWGDYGATVAVDGNSIWFASEYIGQTCNLATYESAPFGSCGGTRTSLANWDTRISLATF
jgi:hypothetical protein